MFIFFVLTFDVLFVTSGLGSGSGLPWSFDVYLNRLTIVQILQAALSMFVNKIFMYILTNDIYWIPFKTRPTMRMLHSPSWKIFWSARVFRVVWLVRHMGLHWGGSERGGGAGGSCWMWLWEKATQIQLVFRNYCVCLFLILSKFHFGTEKYLWSYWTLVIFRPLKVEIHRSTVSTDGLHSKSIIGQQS